MVKVNATINKQHYKTEITSDNNTLIADEPVDNSGQGEGFSPHQLLAASLASCTSITLRMYADRKGWPVEKIDVEVTIENEEESDTYHITTQIHFTGDLSLEQRDRLLEIATKCPIHKTLTNPITIKTTEL